MQIKQELAFRKIYKKMPNQQKLVIDDAIRTILKDPHCGEEKKQDLAGIFVYQFKIENQLYLLAYKFDPVTLTVLLIGVHESFYKSFKIRI